VGLPYWNLLGWWLASRYFQCGEINHETHERNEKREE
jgi:hypothetical protein